VLGFGSHADFLATNYDSWIRAIVFPSRKRIYFRFYKPDGDYYFIDEHDRVKSLDKCWDAWITLKRRGLVSEEWKPLFADTDKVITSEDIKC
jgi:hypothetical protein